MAKRYSRQDVLDTAERLKNWGRWGPDDQAGAVNFITPEDIVAAARLVRRGKVFPLGLALDQKGPQAGLWGGRWNPIHTMLATGTDAVAGKHDETPGLRYGDDAINLPTQCATQWDALAHIFLGEQMWNGYDARLVDARGAHKCGIEHVIGKMVGRGVLLDVARHKGVDFLDDGYAITVADLEATAQAQGIEVRRGDFCIVRTGQMEERLAKGEWGTLRRRPRAGPRLRDLRVDRREGDRRHLQRHLGHRGPPQRDRRAQPAAALGDHPGDGRDPRRDVLREGAGRGLRRRSGLRVLPHGAALEHHRRHRLADQSARDQVSAGSACTRRHQGDRWTSPLAPQRHHTRFRRLLRFG